MMRLAIVTALCGLTLAHSAYAAEPFEVELFEPLPSQGINHLGVGASRVLPHLLPSFGLVLHYQTEPYVLSNDDGDVVTRLVEDRLTTEIWASLGLFDVLEVGLVMPIILAQSGDDLSVVGLTGSVDGASLRDLRIVPKIQLFRSNGFGIGLLGQIFVPTGDADQLASDGAVRGQVRAIFDYEHASSGFALALDGGLDFRPRRATLSHISEDAVRLGLALRIPLGVEWLRLLGTVNALVPLVPDRDFDNPAIDATNGADAAVEVDVALQARFGDFVAAVGAGHGLTDGIGSPELRAFLTVGYTPEARKEEDVAGDDSDKCPGQAEDVDGFQDDDGCPDPDNDKDGILDVVDNCPNVPEDFDGLGDEDGCPEDDFDGDGILDSNDKCPRVPETKNGFQDEDGCPDTVPMPAITLTEVVYFHTAMATIKRESYPLLDSVAELLKAHPEISEVAIDGHADERGSDEYNDALTQRRAAAVVTYLAEHGVARDRMTPRGFGERNPIDRGHDETAWVKNRRVELTVLEMAPATKVTP